MPDFSTNIGFAVKFDLTTLGAPVLVLTDTSTGLSAGVKGRFDITQPNGATRYGNPNLPDLLSGTTSIFRFPLSHATALDWQLGNYAITYTLYAAGYTDTPLSRSFVFNFAGFVLGIQEDFDVFTPLLKYEDVTDYAVAGFNAPTLSRTWVANSAATGNLTSTSSFIDLIFSGNYYSSKYAVSLLTTATYQSTTYSFLSFAFRTNVATATETAFVPPSLALMLTWLTSFRKYLDKQTNVDEPSLYGEAAGLYAEAKAIICAGGNDFALVQKLYAKTHRGASLTAKPTNLPIPAYDYAACGITGSTPTVPLSITTQPQDATITAGATLAFSVVAIGSGTKTYQWYKGSTLISGAVASTYSIANAQTSDSGVFHCVVSNVIDSPVTSNNATGTVNAGGGGGTTVRGYWAQTDTPITNESQILAATPIDFIHNADVTVPFNATSGAPKFLQFFEPVGETVKTYVYVNTGNQYPIASGNYYEGTSVIGAFRAYIPVYASSFSPDSPIFKKTP